MRNFALSLLLLSIFSSISISQTTNYNWITPNKTYLKMYVVQDGMYRIERSDFVNAGINVSQVDPRTVKLYNKGSEVPVYFVGQQDGTFDNGDYFDFYGQRSYGGVTQVYDHLNNKAYTLDEYFNEYSDTNIYWVDWGGAFGARYSEFSFSSPTPNSATSFNDFVHLERDYFYTQGENFGSTDQRFLTTEKYRAEGWMWSSLTPNSTLSDTFSLPMLSTVPGTASFRLLSYPTARNTSIFNEHIMELKVNNNVVATISTNDANRIDSVITFSSSLLNSSVNTVSVRYTTLSGFFSNMNVDLMRINYPRRFGFRNNVFKASLDGVDTTSRRFSVTQFVNEQPVNIYDVKNYRRIYPFTVHNDTLRFSAAGNAKLEVTNTLTQMKPLRIKQRSVPNLVSSSNGADYLMIYNSVLENQAEQLRSYRQSRDNFRAFKAEIEDIYDIFNYGLENPVAVRYFTKHVYDTWQQPRVNYICLFGRGSLDPKRNLTSSSYYRNLVPVYGYPPSDGYFANVNIGTFCYYNMIAIGRIPVYTPSEAQIVVDKIISFEAQQPGDWCKNYIYVTGGGTKNEQISHQTKSNTDINSLVVPPSLSGVPVKVYRTDSSGFVAYNVMDSLKNSIDRGGAFINYRGHAGSHDWEIAMTDPNTLNNGTKLPLILSLTCFTGENSLANYRGFGERFLYLPNKGAIGFVGTTGWSYTQNGNDYGTYITSTIKNDTNRRIGSINRHAQQVMSRDSISFAVRHTLNCYSLIGDPASELRIPRRPELAIGGNDFKLSNPQPAVGDFVTMTAYYKNFGLYTDSTKIRFVLKRDNVTYKTFDFVRKVISYSDSVSCNFQIDSLGNYAISVTLDQDNWIPLEDKSNNSITVRLPLLNLSYAPLKPIENSVVSTDSLTFTGLNPRIPVSGNSIRVILQVDTNRSFNSPTLKTFSTNAISGVSTSFSSIVPVRNNNTAHYWRTNAIVNGDSTGWSGIRQFTYLSNVKASGKVNTDESLIGQTVDIYKFNSSQFSAGEQVNTLFAGDGITLQKVSASLFIRSYGSNAEEASYFSVGNRNVYIDGGGNAGLNLLKVSKLTGSILAFRNFKMNTGTSNDSLVSYLNTYDSTQYLMLLNAAYVPGGQYLSAGAKAKLRQFGSIYCDSIGLMSYFHTWSFIGWHGANSSQTSEMFDPCCRPAPNCVSCDHWDESNSYKDVVFRKSTGTVSNIVGPARQWNSFSWTQNLPPNTSIKFDIYGIDALDNQQYLLFSDITSNEFADLSYVNAVRYPRLNLVAKLAIDTLTGSVPPSLSSIKVNYYPSPELVWDINELTVQSTYKVGEELKFTTNISNVGFTDVPGLVVNVFQKSVSPGNLIYTDTSTSVMNPGVSSLLSRKFTVPYYRDSMNAIVQLGIFDKHNEFYVFNNSITIPMYSVRAYRPVSVKVYSDGALLNQGDNVRKKPEIKVVIEDVGGESANLQGYNNVDLLVNNSSLSAVIGKLQKSNDKTDRQPEQKRNNGDLIFNPELNDGKNTLGIVISGENAESDTVNFDVIVSDDFTIKDLYNFPNPMKGETTFLFTVSGSEQPGDVRIRIYTVGGRLIREIVAPANIGNNAVSWDGRDNDGDQVSNGTYLYKLITPEGYVAQTGSEKLVILR